MSGLLNKVREHFEKNFSQSSAKTYTLRIKKLLEQLNFKGKTFTFTKKIKEIEKILEGKSVSVRKGTFVALSHLSKKKEIKEYWVSKYKNINDNLFKNVKDNVLTDKEKENVICYKEFKKLKIKRKGNEIKYIVLELYKLPFTPRLEYKNIRFGKDDDKNNWIDLEREMIIFNDYKTKGKHMKIEYKLPTKKIVKDLKWHKKWLDKKSVLDYLLLLPMEQSIFSKFIVSLFKQVSNKDNITNNLIRKIKGNHFIKDRKLMKLSENKRDEWFNLHFQHDFQTALTYYKKVELC